MRILRFLNSILDAIRPRDNDFKALQDQNLALTSALAQIGKGFIVSGCTISGATNSSTIATGTVMVGKKLCTLPQQTGVDLTTPKYIVADADVVNTPRATFLGNTHNRYTNQLATISNTKPTNETDYIEISRDYLFYTGWQEISFNSTGTYPHSSLTGSVFYTKDFLGRVHFKGSLSWNTTWTGGLNDLILESTIPLPLKFRPSKRVRFGQPSEINGTGGAWIVEIGEDGTIRLQGNMQDIDTTAGYFTLEFVSFIAS